MTEKHQKTPEQVIAEMKKEMDEKYRAEREALAQKKREEQNALRRMERKLKKEEQEKLGKILYEKFGVTSVAALENEYKIVKKGELTPAVPKKSLPEGAVLLPKEKMALIQSFYQETGEWCLQKQREGSLKESSVPDRVANFFRLFYADSRRDL